MNCSNTTRCDNSKIIFFDDIYACNNCFSLYKKSLKKLNKKIIVKCCDNQYINYKYNIPFCNNCLTMCVLNI